MSSSVEFRNISHHYGAAQVLKDVNLMVAASEFVSLLGPSGSGKSTLLKLLAGMETPSGGDILVDQRSVLATPVYDRGIGMVFQNYALFPNMSVAENIAFPLRVRGTDDAKVRAKVSEMLAVTRLEALAARFPRELSGGQQQRVALARSIVFDPSVLLMDEPLGALDRHLREQLKFEIKRIQQHFKMTVLFVTHDQDEALVLSDRVVVMSNGRIEQASSPQEIYRKPQSKFVAEFVGESNLLKCDLVNGVAELKGRPLGTGKAGQKDGPCWLMLRPEHVALSTDGAARGAIAGTLADKIYLGEQTRYIVDIGGEKIVSKRQNIADDGLMPDQQVFVSWQAENAVVLPA